MTNEDYPSELYDAAIESLDIKYLDGKAYISIHTVDIINESLLSVIDMAIEAGIAAEEGRGQEILSKEMVQGALWVMTIWKNLHDELDVRAEVNSLPDTPASLFEEDDK